MSRLIALTFRSAGGGGDCSFCTAAGDQSESDQPLGLRLGPHSQQHQSHIRGRQSLQEQVISLSVGFTGQLLSPFLFPGRVGGIETLL